MSTLNLRIIAAFVLSLCLTIIPIPGLLGIKPFWVLLLMLYVQLYLPDKFNILAVFLLGLTLDALMATIIGEHAFALLVVTWLASKKARRFCFFSIGQQLGLIGFFCLVYQLTLLMIDAFLGFHLNLLTGLINCLLSILLWPWLHLFASEKLAIRKVNKNRLC